MRDDAGEIVAFDREPEYTDQDRLLLHAARHIDRETTADGFKYSQVTSDEHDASSPSSQLIFRGVKPIKNHVEIARVRAQEAYKKKHPDEDTRGYIWPVVLAEKPKRGQRKRSGQSSK